MRSSIRRSALAAAALPLVAAAARAQEPATFRVGDAVEVQAFGDGPWKPGHIAGLVGVYGGCANYRVTIPQGDYTVACRRIRAAAGPAAGRAAAPAAPATAKRRPSLGTYRCFTMVGGATEARTELVLASATTYRIGSARYTYVFSPADGVRWTSGPLATPYPVSDSDTRWIGVGRPGERWDCRLR